MLILGVGKLLQINNLQINKTCNFNDLYWFRHVMDFTPILLVFVVFVIKHVNRMATYIVYTYTYELCICICELIKKVQVNFPYDIKSTKTCPDKRF